MRSSRGGRSFAKGAVAAVVALAACALTSTARAQQPAQGFALDRFYPSAPSGGWFVMDDLSMRGTLGGAVEMTTGYALKPLRVTDGVQHLAVVSNEATTDFGFAVTYDRWRLYLNLDMPLYGNGQSGTVGNYTFTAPAIEPGLTPDSLADPRFGVDGRILGGPKDPFRLGVGAQLYVPNARPNCPQASTSRCDYDTDGTWRAMLRVLFAGDSGVLTYAGQLGVHVRPLDDAPIPGSPQGSELLFGVAGGARVRVGDGGTALVVGPEIYGETAFRSLLGKDTTGVEGLLTGRLEGTADDGGQLRVKLGTGGGLDQHFGAPEWRVVVGIELFDHGVDRDHDGVTDSKDACPDTPGLRTKDPKTSGCPATSP
jgi:OmpA-OmpF porin, OOP family